MKHQSHTLSILSIGITTLIGSTLAGPALGAIVTDTTYDGAGAVNNAAEWDNGLPGKSPNGGLVSSTDSLSSSWTGNAWTTLDIRHTGGFLFDAADGGLYLTQGAIYEVETDTDYSNVDLEISGDLKLWSNTGTSSEVRIISGRVEANTLSLLKGGTTTGKIEMTNGLLHANAFAANPFATINFLNGGSGIFMVDDLAGFQTAGLFVNFETGTTGSLVLGENLGGNTLGAVNFLLSNGNLSIDGVTSTDPSDFSIVQIGTETTLTLVPEPSTYVLFAGFAALGLVLYRRRTR
jgi:hypothetical protein